MAGTKDGWILAVSQGKPGSQPTSPDDRPQGGGGGKTGYLMGDSGEEISSIQQSYICVGLEIPARGPLPIRHSDLVLIIKTALLQITKN